MDVYQRRRLVALSALAVVFIGFVLLIKSCGGDDEETPVSPLAGATGAGGVSVVSQADYVDQGDAICLQANTGFAAVDQSDPVQAARDEADIIAGELEQLQTLPEPDDGTTKLGNFLNALEKQSAAYEDRATATERGDDATVTELDATIEKAGDDAADAAENFGFKACGNPSKVSESSGGGDSGGDSTTTTPTTDTGGTVTPTTTVAPATTTPAPTTPAVTPTEPAPTEGGGATPTAPPADGGDSGGTSSGGVSP